MILAGDELGKSQGGNNNAYCQDNEIGWVNWDSLDEEFLNFCQKIIAFRKDNPILRQKRFLHAQPIEIDGTPDLFWRRTDGTEMTTGDWETPGLTCLGVEMRMAQGTPSYEPRLGAIYILFNVGEATRITLPNAPRGQHWVRSLDTGNETEYQAKDLISANSVVAYKLQEMKERPS